MDTSAPSLITKSNTLNIVPTIKSATTSPARGSHSKELLMHCLMYGLSLYGEMAEIRA